MNKIVFLLLSVLVFCICTYAQEALYEEEIMVYRQKYSGSYIESDRAPYGEADVGRIQFFDIDPAYRLVASFKKSEGAKPFDMALYSGISRKFIAYGTLHFLWKGESKSLVVYQDISRGNNPLYRQNLFLPFKDLTNGEETYGGGRYMDMKISDISEEKELILDFNKAYNPWCAYSDGYNCPIPPRDNHLDIRIEAGEKGWFKDLNFDDYESND